MYEVTAPKYEITPVPSDWPPESRCCLECGNAEPDVHLEAVLNTETGKQALACTRHIEWVAPSLG
ncbi:hypothetical protein ABT224_20365 [Streptomyces sp. NPDC001584]|uniref:hypothetical protein n=1 Tax=Streptomyces sp. NPDC001584 TaxID=3154521 RepID=UPI003327E57A